MRFSKSQYMKIIQEGGIVLNNSEIDINPGQMSDCTNIELVDPVGWRRIDGYTRFDGTIAPEKVHVHA